MEEIDAMTDPDLFKYDVRVRDRMLRMQRLTETQLATHLEQLPDLADRAEVVVGNQPAIGLLEPEPALREVPRVVAPVAPAVSAPVASSPLAIEDEEDDEDEDEEDDEEDASEGGIAGPVDGGDTTAAADEAAPAEPGDDPGAGPGPKDGDST